VPALDNLIDYIHISDLFMIFCATEIQNIVFFVSSLNPLILGYFCVDVCFISYFGFTDNWKTPELISQRFSHIYMALLVDEEIFTMSLLSPADPRQIDL